MTIGRVGNNQLTRQMLFQLQGQMKMQERLFEQISSNKKILRPSDDPTGVAKALVARDQIDRTDEYEQTIKIAEVATNVTASALDNASATWKRVSEIAVSALDGTKTGEDRAGMAEELEQLLQHLVQVANTTHAGHYIFSGSKTDTPAFRTEKDANTGRMTGVFYNGDASLQKVKTKDGGTVSVNILESNSGDPDQSGTFIDNNQGINAFNTVIQLRDKLLANDIIGISGSGGIIESIDASARSIASQQTVLGASQKILTLDKNRVIEDSATYDQQLSDVEDADTLQLILELNNIQNVYEAALAASGRLLQTGLINFI